MPRPDMVETGSKPRPTIRAVLVALGCFFAVFGARSAYIDAFASDIPNWDQWDAESEYLLVPWLRGEWQPADLLRPHNEHRVVATKLLALALFLVNGQWDARLACLANAALQSLIALAIFLHGRRLLIDRCPGSGPGWQAAWLLAVLAMFAAPMSWQNITSAFHTQQTFLIGLSLATIHLLAPTASGRAPRPLRSVRWWGGIACAVAALGTMGSGLLAAVAAGAMLVVTTPPREVLRRHGATLVVLIGIAALGWFTRHEVSYHDSLKAQSPQAFVITFWRSLQWPVLGFAPFALIAWAPWAWLTWRTWRAGDASPTGERVVVGAGIWVLLQFLAAAYARGAAGDWPANRYLDTVALGIAVNLLALLLLVTAPAANAWWRRTRLAAAAAGVALLGSGWWPHIDDTINGAGPWLARGYIEMEGRTRAYLNTGDPAHLRSGTIPYPSADVFLQRISHEEIRRVLPVSVRVPLAMAAEPDQQGPFRPGATDPEAPPPAGWSVIGSFGADGAAATGAWRSALLPPATGGYWAIPVHSSRPDSPLLGLRLLDEHDREIATVAPGAAPSLPLSAWRLAVVPAPRIPARLVAGDELTDGWLAFGPPIELAAGSLRARQLASLGLPLFWIGLALAGAGTVAGADRVGASGARMLSELWRREVARSRALPRPVLAAVALAGALGSGALTWQLTLASRPAFFQARVSGELHKRSMELFYDRGRGIRGEDSVQVWFEANEVERHLHLRIEPGLLRALRIDPMDHGATLSIEHARLVDINGAVLRELPPALFQPNDQVAELAREGGRLRVTSVPGALDAQLKVPLDPPVATRPVMRSAWARVLGVLLAAVAGGMVAIVLVARFRRPRRPEPAPARSS